MSFLTLYFTPKTSYLLIPSLLISCQIPGNRVCDRHSTQSGFKKWGAEGGSSFHSTKKPGVRFSGTAGSSGALRHLSQPSALLSSVWAPFPVRPSLPGVPATLALHQPYSQHSALVRKLLFSNSTSRCSGLGSDWTDLGHVSNPEPITVARRLDSADRAGLGHRFMGTRDGLGQVHWFHIGWCAYSQRNMRRRGNIYWAN